MTALRAMLSGSIDYAGLFAPAALDMSRAVANYARYRRSDDAWALGRFIVPVARFSEFATSARAQWKHGDRSWRVSAVLTGEPGTHPSAIDAWNREYEGSFCVDAVEVKAATVLEIERVIGALPGALTIYVEVPVASDPRTLLEAVRDTGARAKIRMGGVSADAIPSAVDVARFIIGCREVDVTWKATAGLHHPLCGSYALTYADDAPRGRMYGFLNLFLAATLAESGGDAAAVATLLQEGDAAAPVVREESISWRAHDFTRDQLTDMRAESCTAFGSCSFCEPMDALRELGFL